MNGPISWSAATIVTVQLDLVPPYPVRRSPDVDDARAHTLGWARTVGILGSGDPWFEIWDEQDHADFDLALFAGLVHPDARGRQLELVADWYVLGWYLDDLIMERFKRTRDIAGARAFLAKLSRRQGNSPAVRGLADLWRRTDEQRRDRLTAATPNLGDDALWEIENLVRERPPDPVDYLSMRRLVGGVGWATQLVEQVLEVDLPEALRESTAMRRLDEAFADVVDLHNDLVSYRRETEYEQEINNGAVVSQAFLGTGLADAALRVRQLLQVRLEVFDRLASVDVPALVSGQDAAEVQRYLQGLRDWLAGDYQWHRETARYREASWRKKSPLLISPRGLGTSAARIAVGN